ncbi:MAG: hypothetical protein LBT73_03030 [Tannerellaceae bacterium]|jgi:hypothetical protein|nr:hypothetical protein [Tannerellaceae bacterium]
MRHFVGIALALAITFTGQAQVERRPDGFPYLSHGRYWFVKNFSRSVQNLTIHSDLGQKGDDLLLAALHPTSGETLPLINPTSVKDVKIFHVFENRYCAFAVYSLGTVDKARFAILKKNNPNSFDAPTRASDGKTSAGNPIPFALVNNFNTPFQEDTWIVFPVNTRLNLDLMNPGINDIAAEAERRRLTPKETFLLFTKSHYLANFFTSKEKDIIRWVFGTDDIDDSIFIRHEAQMSPNSLDGFIGWDPDDFWDEDDFSYDIRYFWPQHPIAPEASIANPDMAIIYLSELGDRAWRAHFDLPPDGAVWLDRQKSFALENSFIVISDNFLFLLIHEAHPASDTKKRTVLIFHTDDPVNFAALEAGNLKVKDFHWKFIDGVKLSDAVNDIRFTPTNLHLTDGLTGLLAWVNDNPAATSYLPDIVAKHIAQIVQIPLATTFHNWSGAPNIPTGIQIISPASAAGKEEILQNLFFSDNRFDLRSFGRYTLELPAVLPADYYVKHESSYDQRSHTSTSIYKLSDLEWLSNFYVGAGAYSDVWNDAENRGSFEDFFDEANAGVLFKSWFVVTGDFLFLGIVQDGHYSESALDALTNGFLPPQNNLFVLGIFYCPDGVNTDDLWFGKRSLRSYKWQYVDAFRHSSIFFEEVNNTPEELHLSQGLGAFLDWLALNPNYPAPYQAGNPITFIEGTFYSYSYGNSIAWHLGQIVRKITQNKANNKSWSNGLTPHDWSNLNHNANDVETYIPNLKDDKGKPIDTIPYIFYYNEGSTRYYDIRNFAQSAINNRYQSLPYYFTSASEGATAWKNHFNAQEWNSGKDGFDLTQSWALASDTLLLLVIYDCGAQNAAISYNLFHSHTPVNLDALRAGSKKLKDYEWIYLDGFKRSGAPDDNVNFSLVDIRWLFENGFSSITAWADARPTCPAPKKVFSWDWTFADSYICPIVWNLGRALTHFVTNAANPSYYIGWGHNLLQSSASVPPVVTTADSNPPQSFFSEKATDGSFRYNLLPFIDAAVKRR